MTHAGYILAAYAVSAATLLSMVAWIVVDLAAQQRKLRQLEDEGLRRRSEVAR